MRLLLPITAAAAIVATGGLLSAQAAPTTRVTLRISGGHATDPRDNGRPVRLIAAALGVPAEVFRTAFAAVSPAPGGTEPDPAQVQRNKAELLKVLAPYGVTNERLDAVSDHYRYAGSAGEVWPQRAAVARATLRGGKVVAVTLVSGGAGYTSTPRVTVPGTGATVKVTLAFGRTLATNGRVRSIRLAR
jgi:hypothetical protein